MARFRNIQNGIVVSVADSKAYRFGPGWESPDIDPQPDSEGAYAGTKVADLRAEIDARNEGREDEQKIPTEGNKAVLAAALEADDLTSK